MMLKKVVRLHFSNSYASDISQLLHDHSRPTAVTSVEHRAARTTAVDVLAHASTSQARQYAHALYMLLSAPPAPTLLGADGRSGLREHDDWSSDDDEHRHGRHHPRRTKWGDDPTSDVSANLPKFESQGSIQVFSMKVMSFMYTRHKSRVPLLLQETEPLQLFASAVLSRLMEDDSYCRRLFSSRRAGDDLNAMTEMIEQQYSLPNSLEPEDHIDSEVEQLVRGAMGKVLAAIRAVYHDTNLAGLIAREARALVARCSQPPDYADMAERLIYWDSEWHTAVKMWGPALINQAQEDLNELLPVVTGLMSPAVQAKALEYANSFIADYLFCDDINARPAVRELRARATSVLSPFERARPPRPDTADGPLAGSPMPSTQWRIGVTDDLAFASRLKVLPALWSHIFDKLISGSWPKRRDAHPIYAARTTCESHEDDDASYGSSVGAYAGRRL